MEESIAGRLNRPTSLFWHGDQLQEGDPHFRGGGFSRHLSRHHRTIRYAKFMAIPNYTYLKLKMPGPKGVITVSSSYEHAYECNVECVEYGEAVENTTKLASKLEALIAEALEPKRHAGSF